MVVVFVRGRGRREEERGLKENNQPSALAGNRTRASRVAGENSTTEPPYFAGFAEIRKENTLAES